MTTIFKQLENLTPVAFGGFSELYLVDGKAVKLIEDQDYVGALEEAYLQQCAADYELAPKVYEIARQGNKVAVVMDMIDTNIWYHADGEDDIAPTLMGELNDEQMATSVKLYAKLLKAGIIHADAHSGNIFMNDANEAQAIDFGLAATIGTAPLKFLKRACQFLLPCLERMNLNYLADDLIAAYQTGPAAIRTSLQHIALEVA